MNLAVFTYYFCSSPYSSEKSGKFGDADRDRIDSDAEVFIKTCRDTIILFGNEGKVIIFV